MSLPISSDLINLSYAFQGQPFVDIPAKSTIILTDLSYAYQAQPFMRNPAPSTTTTTPLRMMCGCGT